MRCPRWNVYRTGRTRRQRKTGDSFRIKGTHYGDGMSQVDAPRQEVQEWTDEWEGLNLIVLA